jgi:hypothetical protein
MSPSLDERGPGSQENSSDPFFVPDPFFVQRKAHASTIPEVPFGLKHYKSLAAISAAGFKACASLASIGPFWPEPMTIPARVEQPKRASGGFWQGAEKNPSP